MMFSDLNCGTFEREYRAEIRYRIPPFERLTMRPYNKLPVEGRWILKKHWGSIRLFNKNGAWIFRPKMPFRCRKRLWLDTNYKRKQLFEEEKVGSNQSLVWAPQGRRRRTRTCRGGRKIEDILRKLNGGGQDSIQQEKRILNWSTRKSTRGFEHEITPQKICWQSIFQAGIHNTVVHLVDRSYIIV